MYQHDSINPNPEKVSYDCPVCGEAHNTIITNFRLDVYLLNKVCIFGNDLLTDRICLKCLIEAVSIWVAENSQPSSKKKPAQPV